MDNMEKDEILQKMEERFKICKIERLKKESKKDLREIIFDAFFSPYMAWTAYLFYTEKIHITRYPSWNALSIVTCLSISVVSALDLLCTIIDRNKLSKEIKKLEKKKGCSI